MDSALVGSLRILIIFYYIDSQVRSQVSPYSSNRILHFDRMLRKERWGRKNDRFCIAEKESSRWEL